MAHSPHAPRVPTAHHLSARRRILAVLGGGFVGTLARYGFSLAIQSWLGKSWPYDILLINLSGALLLAFVITLADVTFLVGPTRRLFFTTGLLGAYTTFSSLALGDMLLLNQAAWLPALLYILLSVSGGIAGVLVGDWLGQTFIIRFRRSAPLTNVPHQPGHPPEPRTPNTSQQDLFSSPRSPE